ncbi:MAG: sigma-70 family RNA polymerase sigma factor [Verrucomicrobiota bacterium]
MSDLDLLQNYTRTRSQSAFTALVERHVDLVYSAALRQVRSSQLAEDVAQSVFLDLARRAHELRPGQPLAAWLFVVTRRTAVDTIRSEARRQAREHTAAEIAAMKTPSPTWLRVKDEIDEALSTLNDAERSALLLRFFENKSLREVGASLGISEDTAQKRVSRALERLRDLLVRRGVVVSSAGLAADLSAHAVHSAPAILGSAIVAAVPIGSVVGASTPFAATTLLSHAVAAAVVVGALGFAAFEASALVQQQHEISATRNQLAQHRATLASLRTAQEAAASRIQQTRTHLASMTRLSETDPAVEAAITAWLQRLERLKTLVAQRADLAIPELAVLTDEEWFATARDAKLDSERDTQATFRQVHTTARKALALAFSRALKTHADAHEGLLPAEPIALAAFIPQRLPGDLFTRFEMLQKGKLGEVAADARLLAERLEAARARGDRVYVNRSKFGVEDL